MRGSIIFQNLWERLYHELAFLAESGRDVSYAQGNEIKDDWKKMQTGKWHCACCDTYLEPIDSSYVICPECGLRHRFKNGVIQTKGNMMEDYE